MNNREFIPGSIFCHFLHKRLSEIPGSDKTERLLKNKRKYDDYVWKKLTIVKIDLCILLIWKGKYVQNQQNK